MKIDVIKRGGEWMVEFGYDNQTFTLYYTALTKKEAEFMRDSLKHCFEKYINDITQ